MPSRGYLLALAMVASMGREMVEHGEKARYYAALLDERGDRHSARPALAADTDEAMEGDFQGGALEDEDEAGEGQGHGGNESSVTDSGSGPTPRD
eukprot:10362320-Lingulodinium_polyedra.AAC.1